LRNCANGVRAAKRAAEARLEERSHDFFVLGTTADGYCTCFFIDRDGVEGSEVNYESISANCRPGTVAASFRDESYFMSNAESDLRLCKFLPILDIG
jgi:hypothetical protein